MCYVSGYKTTKFHFYADYTQLYIHLSPGSTAAAFTQLQQCLCDVQSWIGSNKLKLNPDKTEFISAAVALANALVSSRLDHCNSLMTSMSCKDLINYNVSKTHYYQFKGRYWHIISSLLLH